MATYTHGEDHHHQDPLHRFFERLVPYWKYVVSNKKYFIAGGIILVIIAGSIFGWSYYQASINHKAQVLFGQAFEEARPAKQVELYKGIIERYPKTSSALFASLVLAKQAFEEKDYDQVISWLEPVIRAGEAQAFLRVIALYNMASAYEAKGDWDKAIEYYQESTVDVQNKTQDWSRYHLARVYAQKGDKKKAQVFYQEILDGSQDPELKDLSMARILWLEEQSTKK